MRTTVWFPATAAPPGATRSGVSDTGLWEESYPDRVGLVDEEGSLLICDLAGGIYEEFIDAFWVRYTVTKED